MIGLKIFPRMTKAGTEWFGTYVDCPSPRTNQYEQS